METSNTLQSLRPTFTLMQYTYVLLPIAAGFDKFTNLLVDWKQYIHPALLNNLPIESNTFMMIVGLIEVCAGIIVFIRPRVGGLIVSAWLALIALTLLASGHYLDVAVRDIVMAIGAYSMAIIAKKIKTK